MSPPARLLQLHGAIVDLIYQVEAVPPPGGEARVRGFTLAAGGGFNAAVAAKRSGLEVRYGGAIGSGPLGEIVLRALEAEGIAPLRPRDPNRDQGCCTVMLDRSGERTFVASEGAEGHLTEDDLRPIDVTQFGWSLISGYTLAYPGSAPALTRWLERTELPTLVFDPSPVIDTVPPEATQAALARAAWVSANRAEAACLTGASDPEDAAAKLAEGRTGAMVRLGAEGCVLASAGAVLTLPGHPVEAVDTNGAGDAHTGAFIAALARGTAPAEAARYANVAAALATTRFGPATAPDRATIETTLHVRKAG